MSRKCPDCGVSPGDPHDDGCDVARCTNCGTQAISCDCDRDDPVISGMPRDRWTGEWPGDAACREFGLYARMVPGEGWVPCGPDDPEAEEDLNRLVMSFRWDRAKQRWVKP